MRSTFKLRQPLNFALAAAASKQMPSLSLLKACQRVAILCHAVVLSCYRH